MKNAGFIVETGVPTEDLKKVPAAARRAEDLGYAALLSPEINRDPFFRLVAAEHTSRIGLGTSVAIAFPRAPMVVAQIAWDLQRFSGGRFALGIGSQVRKHNEERFSVAWSAPVPRMREYVQTLRTIWDSWQNGTRPSFEGKHYRYTYTTPFFNPGPIDHPRIPVHVSAVNPAMCRLAGEVCDGARLHSFCTRRYLDEVILPNVERGAAKAGRRLEDIELSGGGFLATGPDDEAVDRQLETIRQQISFYGSTPSYFGVLETHGGATSARRLNRMSRDGKWRRDAAPSRRRRARLRRGEPLRPDRRAHPRALRGMRRLAFAQPRHDAREERRCARCCQLKGREFQVQVPRSRKSARTWNLETRFPCRSVLFDAAGT
jgi:probable F420-dependent oxidoreductase